MNNPDQYLLYLVLPLNYNICGYYFTMKLEKRQEKKEPSNIILDMVPLLSFISLSSLIPNVLEFLLLVLESVLPE